MEHLIGDIKESHKPHVLVIDDREENQLAFDVSLRGLECNLVYATSGPEALALIDHQKFAAIILDIQMPIMDGFEVAKRIRNSSSASVTPILFVSAIDHDSSLVEKAYAAGGTAFLAKPFSPSILEGKVRYFLKLFERIQENDRRNEEAIVQAETEKSRLLENSLDAVVGAGPDEKILYWNRYAEIIFGWSKSEAVGQSMAEMIVPESYREAHRDGMARFLKTGESKIQNQRLEVPALRKNGTEFMVELTVTSMKAADGTFRFYSFIRDITELIAARKAAAEIKAAKEEAERANVLKSAFLANMSHEIRTPLGAMLGFAALLQDTVVSDDDRRDFSEVITRNGRNLSVIINDILDLSKVEAGHLTLERSEGDPREIAEDVCTLLRMKADEKKSQAIVRNCDGDEASQNIQ